MHDNVDRPLLADPMFEAICAAIEESEKSWASVAEFEDAVSQRFKLINDKGGRTKKKVYTAKDVKKRTSVDAGDVNEAYSEAFASEKATAIPAVNPSVVREGINGMNE